ncbi:MAG: cytochrome c oxidase subunit II [Proteobacteria bacterium]|nr:cytochrome c oxidase subunit II [Pseudomonadota bacterium]
MIFRTVPAALASLFILGAGGAVSAGAPEPWQLGFQAPASPVMTDINDLHNFLLWIIIVIALFVTGLLLFVVIRFGAKRHPVPTRTTHNTVIEVIWTVVPIMILAVIAVPSFRLLYFMDRIEAPEMTLKAIGHQWYWSYEYPDHGNFTFDSTMIPDEDIKPGQKRLLEVDNRVILPVDTNIRILMTSTDVIHAWAVPAFGVKTDTIPGRLSEAWVRIDREGVYYGQCSELCGIHHGFMPIAVEAVSKEAFKKWVETAKKKFARADTAAPVALLASAGGPSPRRSGSRLGEASGEARAGRRGGR